ncbi:MAG: thiamine-phosphate kinase [Bacteroidales bacterium]|nr:thiamine-phosphate kinase [Bacteroidales bacterium]
MADKKQVRIEDIGEFGLIRRLTDDIVIRHPSTKTGIGDDAAVLDHGRSQLLVTSDLLVEGIHFDLTYVPLKHLGYKSVVVNLSDIYAMNGHPKQITVNLAISSKMKLEAVEELYRGIKLACSQYEVDLAGGDTSASLTGLLISITAIGTVAKGRAALRSGARKGDLILVTGDLGAAYLGLLLLQREKKLFEEDPETQPKLDQYPYVLERQLKPEARHNAIALLYQHQVQPTSMIDISDGLSSDVMHLCDRSKLGCRIYADKLPFHPETESVAEELFVNPVVAALNGGEDYELLFTVSPEDYPKLHDVADFTTIGHMVDQNEGYQLVLSDQSTVPLVAQGWDGMQSE